MEYIKIGQKVIDIEIKGLDAVKKSIDQKFINIVDLILNSQGKLVISGMGKSGHIANKIAATFASTGTPSVFLHPGEASHGDLGIIAKEDVVFLLSNSGETKELGDIINYCTRFNISLIALVRRKTSLLVKQANIAVILPEIEEASSINAPTTSTSMMLSYGDALAVVVAKQKGFTKDDFGILHPGGKIGSQFIKTSKIMRKSDEVPLINQDKNMSLVIDEMTKKSIGTTGVIDDNGNLVGIITDGDLRRHLANNILALTAKDIMNPNPKVIDNNSLALEGVNIMQKLKITTVFVIDDYKPVGVLHIHDCFKAGLI